MSQKECGCRIVGHGTDTRIEYCPLHAAAGEMLVLLKRFHLPEDDQKLADEVIKRAEGLFLLW